MSQATAPAPASQGDQSLLVPSSCVDDEGKDGDSASAQAVDPVDSFPTAAFTKEDAEAAESETAIDKDER